MQLVFEVCDTRHGEPPVCKLFDGAGGVIGRGSACDWTLADPQRLMSSHHCLVSFREGQYYLTDISTNGTGMPDSPERLRKGHMRLISDGDIYRLGAVSIRARLKMTKWPEFAPGGVIPDDVFLGPDPVLAQADEPWRNSSGNGLDGSSKPLYGAAQPTDLGPVELDHLDVPQWGEPVGEAVVTEPVEVLPTSCEAFWLQFGQVLGMPLDGLDTPGREALALKVASLLKHSVEGVWQGLRTRDELSCELNLAWTFLAAQGDNPLKDSADGQAALTALLCANDRAERDIAHACRDMQVHQLALVVASRAAVRSALAAFAPSQLLLCFEREGNPPRFPTDGSRWRAYQRYYHRLRENDAMVEQLFSQDFSSAYQEQVRLVSTLHTAYPG